MDAAVGCAGSLSTLVDRTLAARYTGDWIPAEMDDTLYTHPSCRLRRDLSDKATMRLVQGGCVEGVGLLFERYSRLVLSVATRILRDRAEAQDLLQDVFLYILRRGSMFDSARGTVVSWVLQLTYSKSLNLRTRLGRHVPIDLATHEADPEMGPERVTEKLSAGKVVRLALAELTEAQRETLYLYFFEGYSLVEVSGKRSEPLGNTRHHYYRGIAALRSVIIGLDRSGLERRMERVPRPRDHRETAQRIAECRE